MNLRPPVRVRSLHCTRQMGACAVIFAVFVARSEDRVWLTRSIRQRNISERFLTPGQTPIGERVLRGRGLLASKTHVPAIRRCDTCAACFALHKICEIIIARCANRWLIHRDDAGLYTHAHTYSVYIYGQRYTRVMCDSSPGNKYPGETNATPTINSHLCVCPLKAPHPRLRWHGKKESALIMMPELRIWCLF